ncbi:hypothetical protein [Clavibacter zhangzhiyongii]|uniref:hypothetical protein n=1 Tax=Clavibacter zhangzhiyongii TaxID=2768071 RepID=UPI0039E05F9A
MAVHLDRGGHDLVRREDLAGQRVLDRPDDGVALEAEELQLDRGRGAVGEEADRLDARAVEAEDPGVGVVGEAAVGDEQRRAAAAVDGLRVQRLVGARGDEGADDGVAVAARRWR